MECSKNILHIMSNTSNKKLVTTEYIVLYIDFLGSERKIEENQDKWLRNINDIFKKSINFKRFGLQDIFKEEIKNSFVKIFSDNIVIGVKTPSNGSWGNSIRFLMYIGSFIQSYALGKYSWLLRGAMVKGSLYESLESRNRDNEVTIVDMIWGKALVNAHRIESKHAIYPRIIIDSSVEKSCCSENNAENDDNIQNNKILFKGDYKSYFSRDNDGLLFLNFYPIYHGMISEGINLKLYSIDDIIKKLKLENKNDKDKSIQQKIDWAIHYFQSFKKKNYQKIIC